MKKNLFLLTFFLLFNYLSNAQVSGYTIPSNTSVSYLQVRKIDTLVPGDYLVVRRETGWLGGIPFNTFITPLYRGFDSLYRSINWHDDYNLLNNKPIFSPVAFNGDYNSLLNRPLLNYYPNSNPENYPQANGDTTQYIRGDGSLNQFPFLITSYHQLTDTLSITPINISNWNTAFSWGNPLGVYTPLIRTITINGNTQDLSSNRTWSVGTLVGNDTNNLSSRINAKQDALNGIGIVKSTSGIITYDNTSYYPNSNPNGYTSNTGTVTNVSGTTNRVSVINGTTTPIIDIASNYAGQASITTLGTISSGVWNGTTITKIDTSITGTKYQDDTMRTRLNTSLNSKASLTFYNKSGITTVTKVFCDTITPTTATGFAINISSAGFNSIKNVQVSAQNNTSSLLSIPLVSIQSVSNTTVTINLLNSGSQTLSILGTLVQGLTFSTNLSGYIIHIRVEGN